MLDQKQQKTSQNLDISAVLSKNLQLAPKTLKILQFFQNLKFFQKLWNFGSFLQRLEFFAIFSQNIWIFSKFQ